MKRTYTRLDVENLSLRLISRGTSKLLVESSPQLATDLRMAGEILVWVLTKGMPISTIDIEDDTNGHPTRT